MLYQILCFHTDSIPLKITEQPFACINSTIVNAKLEFQLKDILTHMLTRPQG